MKKMMILACMMTIAITASAMSYSKARSEALFLSDKMAYELELTDAQYDAVYEINLDYLMSLNGHADIFGVWWNRRNQDLRYVLTSWQYDIYMGRNYFYRPVSWFNNSWLFNIYTHYVHRNYFYKPRPTVYISYRGGNNKKHHRYYAERKVHPSTRGKAYVTRHDRNEKINHSVRPDVNKNRRPETNKPNTKPQNDRSHRSASSSDITKPTARPVSRPSTQPSASVSTHNNTRSSSARPSTSSRSNTSRTSGGRGSR